MPPGLLPPINPVSVCARGIGYASSTEEFRMSISIGVNYLFDISYQRSFIETENNLPGSLFNYIRALVFCISWLQAPVTLRTDVEDRLFSFFAKHRVDPLFIGVSRRLEFVTQLSTGCYTANPASCSQRQQDQYDTENNCKACDQPDQC